MPDAIFHLALNVADLAATRDFYGRTLGCAEGRSAPTWVDYDFFGHQISLHLGTPAPTADTGRVGEHLVPMPHFGAVLAPADWDALAARLEDAGVDWVLPPQVRFAGEPGEQRTMFFRDPSGNAIEVKSYPDPAGTFAA